MISSIKISGYRGLQGLEMSGLGRVNLLVGTNNSGKTSVLEAIEILMSKGNPVTIRQTLWRRGERITTLLPTTTPDDQPAPRIIVETDVCHLFTGHAIHPGTHFSLEAKNQTPQRSVTVEIVELSPKERAEIVASQSPPGDVSLLSRLALKITGHPMPATARVPLSKAGGISSQFLDFPQRRGITSKEISPSQFITTDSLSGDQLVGSWGQVALKPEEEMVLDALRVLDKDIERIAPLAPSQGPYFWTSPGRGGFMVKRKSSEQPVPIGSMGDGMWRLLAMSIAITLCKGGTLLVDEIDTGLHHTVMSSMWKLIFNAAKQFDVQVFATTHSYDCIYSLAQLVEEHSDAENPITVQRVEPGRSEAVPFSEQELTVAAEREIEVR